jgi:hypothetical protein
VPIIRRLQDYTRMHGQQNINSGRNNGCPKYFEICRNNKYTIKNERPNVGPGSYSSPVRECCEIHCLVFVKVRIFRGLVKVHEAPWK